MAESTTWRVRGVDTEGRNLQLSTLGLYTGTTAVGSGAVITSSHNPIAGTLAALTDGDPLTSCTWAAADVQAPGFYIQWALPAAAAPWGPSFAMPNEQQSVKNYLFGYISGALWTWTAQGRVRWPGANVETLLPTRAPRFGEPIGWVPRTGASPGSAGFFACAMSDNGGTQILTGYGGSNSRFSVSTDGGSTWVQNARAGGSIGFGGCTVSPDGSTLIVCGRGDTSAPTYISRDGGNTWTTIAGLTAGLDGFRKAAISKNNLVVFLVSAGSAAPVYKSTDAGATWAPVAGLTPGSEGYSACSVSHDGQTVVVAPVGNSSVLQISKDGGNTWQSKPGASPGPYGFGFCAVSPDGATVMATGLGSSSSRVNISLDAGSTWTYAPLVAVSGGFEHCATGLSGKHLGVIARNASGGSGSYFAMSADYGRTWNQESYPTPGTTGFVGCALSEDYGDALVAASGSSSATVSAYVRQDRVYDRNPPRTARAAGFAFVGDRDLHPQGVGAMHVPEGAMFVDREFGGLCKIYGSVARKNTPTNVPLRRRVRLHRSRDGLLIRETWSKGDGSYEFLGISGIYEYDVIAWDHEMSYRTVVANNLIPEAM